MPLTLASCHPQDVIERPDSYVIRADAPGFDPSDINIEVHDGVITISAEHEEQRGGGGDREGRALRRERVYRVSALQRWQAQQACCKLQLVLATSFSWFWLQASAGSGHSGRAPSLCVGLVGHGMQHAACMCACIVHIQSHCSMAGVPALCLYSHTAAWLHGSSGQLQHSSISSTGCVPV